MTEQRTEPMSDERLKEIDQILDMDGRGSIGAHRYPFANELRAEVKRLRSIDWMTERENLKAENARLRRNVIYTGGRAVDDRMLQERAAKLRESEDMKVENARLRQEVEGHTAARLRQGAENKLLRREIEHFKDLATSLRSRIFESENERSDQQYFPHPDTILLDKLERKVRGGWRVEIDYFDLQDPWFKLTLRGPHGEREEFGGPTLRSVAALEEKQ